MTTPKQAAAEFQRLHDRVVKAAFRYLNGKTESKIRLADELEKREAQFSAALRRLFDLPELSND